jgi:XRE family transcriptional regulator, regulator of sulfur utilization
VARPQQNLKILGDAIRQYRCQAGLSQEELAEKADLHPVYVGKIERGEQWISLHALLRVAKALKMRVRDLVENL